MVLALLAFPCYNTAMKTRLPFNQSGNITRFNPVRETVDIFVMNAGLQAPVRHMFGPYANDYHVLQYILHGKGTLEIGEKSYPLQAGDLFLLPMNVSCRYFSDETDPYEYYWIGFGGHYANTMLQKCGMLDNPVYHLADKHIEQLFRKMFYLLGKLLDCNADALVIMYTIFSRLLKRTGTIELSDPHGQNAVLRFAIDYMRQNYKNPIAVSDICNTYFLNRTYFSELFKRAYNISPHAYLTNLRLTISVHLLKDTDLSVSDIAVAVGMNYMAYLKSFKKKYFCTPTEYKKRIKSGDIMIDTSDQTLDDSPYYTNYTNLIYSQPKK